jgi:hypothetical protein
MNKPNRLVLLGENMEMTQTPDGEVLIFAIRGKVDSQTSKMFEERLIPPIKNVFDIAGFSAVFPIFPSSTAALAELKSK